jgi:hypothetical protein
MTIEVNIKKEDIEKFVQEALLKSAIGETINEAIKKSVTSTSYYDKNSPIQQAVDNFIRQQAGILIRENYSETIISQVKVGIEERFTAEKIKQVVDRAVDDVTAKLERYDY